MHRVVCLLIGAWSALLTASLDGTAAESATGKNRVSPWPDLYEVIESPETDRLVRRGLELGQKWLGKPRYKPRKVQLRLSKPRDPTRKIKTGFSLTELSDPKAGVFTIYLSARTDQKSFHGLLAHEIFHVFQPQVKDVYMEGFVTYLAEKLCRAEGLQWEIWQKHFEADGDPVYGGAFKLMKELEKIVGEEALFKLIRYRTKKRPARRSKDGPNVLDVEHIDIDRWLDALDTEARDRARRTIAARYLDLETARRKTHADYGFRRPRVPGNGR